MSTLAYTIGDTATMLRRNLRHMQRYLSLSLFVIGIPVVLLLLFVYVFGGTLGTGLGRPIRELRCPRYPPDHRGRGRAGHGDRGRDGHDRGHHRAISHHG